ncbi:MAG: NADP-dependent oxidoreductase [Hyphomicrobiaceae bacterium]
MKAVFIEQYGGPEVLKYGDRPDPAAGAGEVVLDVHAASVNGADWKVRAGGHYKHQGFPLGIGRDFSGVVSAVGAGVSDLKPGDAVFGVCDVGQEAAYAEKLRMKASLCALKPESLSHVDAAAVALIGLTALVSVEDTLKLKRGETILVQGGAGGVASFAIQLAKHLGARVITTTSAGNADYVKSLGADQVVDYRNEDFSKVVSGCDAVFETVGGDTALKSFDVLKPGGRAAFIASGTVAPKPPRDDVTSLRPSVTRDRPHLDRIAELVTSGAVRVPEVKTFSLSQAAEAMAISEGRHFRGKLVFKIR